MKEDIEKEVGKALENELDRTSENVKEGGKSGGEANPQTLIYKIETLNFIKNNSGVVFGDEASLEDVVFGGESRGGMPQDEAVTDRDCMVEDKKRLSQWLAQHYNDFEMAFLLALAVFEEMPCMWVYEMAEDLFEMMEGDKEESKRKKMEIPHQQRIETAGGQQYRGYIYNHTGRVESEFIRYQKKKYAPRILECVWSEFRYFRETLIIWLEQYISETNYSKTIKAINALSQLLGHDFSYCEKKVIEPLLKRKDYIVDFAVAQIIVQTHGSGQYRDNVEKLYYYWTKQRNLHMSFIALMICASEGWPQELAKSAIEGYIDEMVKAREEGWDNGYEWHLPLFYAIGRRKAFYFKALVEALYSKMMQYSSRKDRDRKKVVGVIFWKLILIDDMESHIDVNRKEKHRDMIFVKMCLIKNDVAPKVQELWKYLWKSRDMHKKMKDFLEKYLFQYGGCGKEHTDYLRQFLFSFQDTPSDRENMEFFLKKISLRSNLSVKAAEKINQRSI